MALSFFQKLRMGFKGWSRRREQDTEQRNREFIARNTGWAAPQSVSLPESPGGPASREMDVDLEGLQVAFLDDSGRLEHYLDLETGEVVEFLSKDAALHAAITSNGSRYRRVPTRDAKSDALDRQSFPATLDASPARESLERVDVSDSAGFRRALAADRTVERRWYSFKNDRATEAIQRWLKEIGLR